MPGAGKLCLGAWERPGFDRAFKSPQVEFEISRVLIAFAERFSQRLAEDIQHLKRQFWIQLDGRAGLLVDDGVERVDRRLALKWPLACEEFIEDHAQREDIGPVIDRPSFRLLG